MPGLCIPGDRRSRKAEGLKELRENFHWSFLSGLISSGDCDSFTPFKPSSAGAIRDTAEAVPFVRQSLPQHLRVSEDFCEINHQCLSNATPQHTNTAANQRLRSTFSCRTHPAATALLTKVREPAAGAIRLTSAWLREKSKEKKLRAIKATPPENDLHSPPPRWPLISLVPL